MTKDIVLNRGLPGSGKSTAALREFPDGLILSADDYFIIEGQYCFDPSRLKDAHTWNLFRAIQAMDRVLNKTIVIDNTNIVAEHARPYVEAAQLRGYGILIREARTPWAKDVDECTRRNTHNVPRHTIQRMANHYEDAATFYQGIYR